MASSARKDTDTEKVERYVPRDAVNRPVRPARRATARDVAEQAGVSVSLVSLVVNGKADGRVAETTRRRILQAVDALGYQLHAGARSLARQEPQTVAVVCPEMTNPFYATLIDGLSEAISARYALNLVIPSGLVDYDEDLAGLVLAAPRRSVIDKLDPYCPTIVLDSPGTHCGFPAIDMNVTSAGRQLAEHLISLGHRKIAYVGSTLDKASLKQRRAGLVAGLREYGAELTEQDLLFERIVMDVAKAGLPQAWATWRDQGVTAVVCADDVYAYGVLAAGVEIGIRVPEDLAVASYNDLAFSALTTPPLTSVSFPAREVGFSAGQMLLRYIDTGRPPRGKTLQTRLKVRASTDNVPASTNPRPPAAAAPRGPVTPGAAASTVAR
jgi:DNA-binding LacI/PurR family transcriptional regulator